MSQCTFDLDERVRIVVDNRIRISLRHLPPEVVDAIKHDFTHVNPARAKLERLGLTGGALYKEPRTIQTYELEHAVITVPRGGMTRVRAALEQAGLARHVVDERCEGDPRLAGKIPPHAMATDGILYDFQREILDQMLVVQNGFVRAPTGSGKSAGALAFAAAVNLPTCVVVHNTGLLKQWIANASDPRQLGLSPDDIGIVGGGVFRIRPLTIAMQQSIRREDTLKRIRTVFGAVIPDELQTAAAATFAATYDQFPAKYRLGMSANERRADRKEFLIYDLFGDEPIVDVDQDDLIERGVVHDVDVMVVLTEFVAPWYEDLKHRVREAEQTTKRTGQPMPRDLIAERIGAFDRLLNEMMVDKSRQYGIAEIVRDEVLNNGEQVLILSHRREHCARNDADVSAAGVRCGRMVGGVEDREEFERSLRMLRDGSLSAVAGTYQAIGTGIDLPSVAVGVCTTPIAGGKDGKSFYQQVRGRLCRRAEGKHGARIYYLLDRNVFGLEPLRNLIRWNNTVRVFDGGAWHDARVWIKELSL